MGFHYIDIHSHILPDLDDGAETMAETMEMLKLACEHGTREIVATPHFGQSRYMHAQDRRNEIYREVCAQIERAGLPIKLYLGNEIYYERSGMKCIEEKLAETMAGTRYVLVEYSTEADYQTILGSVRSIRQSGHSAIIAHIERYKCLINRKDLVEMLIEQGAYIQVNAASVYKGGVFRKYQIKNLLDAELVHFIASDAHDTRDRRPVLDKCAHYLLKHYDEAYVKKLLWGNPKKMLRDEYIDE